MPEERPYEVSWLPEAQRDLAEIRRIPREPAQSRAITNVLRYMLERLRQAPLAVGEIYRARGNVVEHSAVWEIIGFDFAVDTKHRFVVVRRCFEMDRREN